MIRPPWLAWCLVFGVSFAWASGLRGQTVTPEELKQFYELLKEPDGKESYERRLAFLVDVFERIGDSKRRLSGGSIVGPKSMRIPSERAIPFLTNFAHHPSSLVQFAALKELAVYRTEAKHATPHIRHLLESKEGFVAEEAAKTIAKIDPGNREVAEALVNRLAHGTEDDSWKRAALMALVEMTDVVPKSAMAIILPFREHRWTESRIAAFEIVGKLLHPKLRSLDEVRALEYLDWRKEDDHGYSVLRAIQEGGAKAEFAIPLLVELLTSSPPTYVECATIQTLAKVKTGNPRMISAVLERLVASDLTVAHHASKALGDLDFSDAKSVRALAAGMRHANPRVRHEAAVRLRSHFQGKSISESCRAELAPPLLATLNDVNEETAPGSLEVTLSLLSFMGKDAAPAKATLKRLYEFDAYFRKHDAAARQFRIKPTVVDLLAGLGVPEELVPLLRDTLKAGPRESEFTAQEYASAARALTLHGERTSDLVPWLIPALTVKGSEAMVSAMEFPTGRRMSSTAQIEALKALTRIGPPAKDALPRLRELAEQKEIGMKQFDWPIFRHNTVIREARAAIAAIEKQ